MKCAYYLLPLALCLFLFSCGGSEPEKSGSGSTNSGTGTIAFDLEWQHSSQGSIFPDESRSARQAAVRASSDCCVDYGISTVSVKVFNSSNVQIASGDWPCSAHQGTLTGVPVGSNHWIRLEGIVSGGGVNWRGEKTGITVVAGSSANAGTITMAYIGSDHSLPIVSSTGPSNNSTNVPVTSAITVTFSKAMASSCINTATFSLQKGTIPVSGSTSYDSSTKTATFMPSSNLDYNASYTALITTDVEDMVGNHMGANYQWSFTTESLPTGPPSVVSGVTATGGDRQVTVSWGSATGATSYNIYWSTASGVTKATGTKISNVTISYTHVGLTNGTTYYYVVTAVNVVGESGESSEVSATPGTVPSAPTGVAAVAGDGQVSVSWNLVSGATSYNIYWSTTTGVTKSGTKIANVVSPYTHTGLTNGTTYYYVVTAVNSTGESGVSSQISGTPVSSVDRWVATGPMIQGRFKHSATLLPNGKVLIAGGVTNLQYDNGGDYLDTAELYDPTSGKFSSTGNMKNRRGWHGGESPAVALLNNGNVLLAGGWDDTNGSAESGGIIDQTSAELYSPSTGNFASTGSMSSSSSFSRTVLMHDGRVLIVGNTAMIYDPISAVFSPISGIIYLRSWHTATLLPNGKVLITGGGSGSGNYNAAELFDPVAGTFSLTGNMNYRREDHQATLLPSGKVLITGGLSAPTNEALDTAEIYDPTTESFSVIGKMNYPRQWHRATLLSNGKVLIAGGSEGPGGNIDVGAKCEIYDPVTGQFRIGSSMISSRYSFLATKLPDGSVLVTGGAGGPRASELYIPSPASDTTPPSNPSVVINSGAARTTSRSVTLTLSASDDTGVFGYYASESPTAPLSVLSTWMPIAAGTNYSGTGLFTLSPGAGSKTIYIWFKDVAGNMSAAVSASIILE